ncbi:hypothetical protein A2U01_0004335 [Trifolium medium]|uniref:Uncharacterized protein n=1 Tax=Trifolium medium TaxID=97028 RepID=A0A392M7R1_9FABA|nr:hypothetical protein [Trifolium medium]
MGDSIELLVKKLIEGNATMQLLTKQMSQQTLVLSEEIRRMREEIQKEKTIDSGLLTNSSEQPSIMKNHTVVVEGIEEITDESKDDEVEVEIEASVDDGEEVRFKQIDFGSETIFTAISGRLEAVNSEFNVKMTEVHRGIEKGVALEPPVKPPDTELKVVAHDIQITQAVVVEIKLPPDAGRSVMTLLRRVPPPKPPDLIAASLIATATNSWSGELLCLITILGENIPEEVGVLGLNQLKSSNWDFAFVDFKRKGKRGLPDTITGNFVFRKFVQQREFTYDLKWLILMNGNCGFQVSKHFDFYDFLEQKDFNYKDLAVVDEIRVRRVNGVSNDSMELPLFGVLCKFRDVQVENKWMRKYYRMVVSLMHKHCVCDDLLKIIQCLGDISEPEYILKLVKKHFVMGRESLENNITAIKLTLHKTNFPPKFVMDDMLTPLKLEECDCKWETMFLARLFQADCLQQWDPGEPKIPMLISTHECCWKGFPSLYSLLNFVYDRGKLCEIPFDARDHQLELQLVTTAGLAYLFFME